MSDFKLNDTQMIALMIFADAPARSDVIEESTSDVSPIAALESAGLIYRHYGKYYAVTDLGLALVKGSGK